MGAAEQQRSLNKILPKIEKQPTHPQTPKTGTHNNFQVLHRKQIEPKHSTITKLLQFIKTIVYVIGFTDAHRFTNKFKKLKKNKIIK